MVVMVIMVVVIPKAMPIYNQPPTTTTKALHKLAAAVGVAGV